MVFVDFFKKPDINAGVKEFQEMPGAVLLDVRTMSEYRKGRVPGSRNVPLTMIWQVTEIAPDPETPIFVYCLSGARSRAAAAELAELGYQKVKDLGGIASYKGKVEK